MESPDDGQLFSDKVWEIYRRQWEKSNSGSRIRLYNWMLRWQELVEKGTNPRQAYFMAVEEIKSNRIGQAKDSRTEEVEDNRIEEVEDSRIDEVKDSRIEEEIDAIITEDSSGKRFVIPPVLWKRIIPLIVLCLALAISIIYSMKFNDEKNTAITELEYAQSMLVSTQSDHNATIKELQDTEDELSSAVEELDEIQATNEELKDKYSLARNELITAETNLQNEQDKTSCLMSEIAALQAEIQLYNDAGLSVNTDITSPYKANLGSLLNLENNPEAINVSWSELLSFLLEDEIDKNLYIDNEYTCGEFAEDLHNNAEASGIKAAFVVIQFDDGSDAHALNAFMTSDRGLVYIDVTGTPEDTRRPLNMDCKVNLKVGDVYYKYLLFPDEDWLLYPTSKIVSSIEIYW